MANGICDCCQTQTAVYKVYQGEVCKECADYWFAIIGAKHTDTEDKRKKRIEDATITTVCAAKNEYYDRGKEKPKSKKGRKGGKK